VDLSPPILHNEGLAAAIRWLAHRMHQQYGLEVQVQAEQPLPMANADLRVLLFQIVRELLFNVVKHAGVMVAKVMLNPVDGRVEIVVTDDGHGFSPEFMAESRQSSQGLQRIAQRLQLLGGHINISSTPGHGTRITLDSPLDLEEKPL
jgi:signal transduction histidine kinase